MLSRTADHLFWMARYMERAENTARMLDVNYQMSLLPQSEDAAERGWRGLLSISELTGDFAKRYGGVTAKNVMDYMVSLGIAADRMVVVSKGEEAPLCTETTEACYARNRRGHFVITAK